jgi:hypothetical protein
MCNNEINLPLFILIKLPYLTGRDDLSFLSSNFILFILYPLQMFQWDDLVFFSFIYLYCIIGSSIMVYLYFLMDNDYLKLQNFNIMFMNG